jgi:hypothetical protein
MQRSILHTIFGSGRVIQITTYVARVLLFLPLTACGGLPPAQAARAAHSIWSLESARQQECDLDITLTARILMEKGHPCQPWLQRVFRRVVQIPRGSAVIAGLVPFKPAALPGLLITARHTSGYFEPDLILEDPLAVQTPREFKPVFPQLVTGNGEQCERYNLSSSIWFSPKLTETDRDPNGRPTNVIPRRDFALGIVVGERQFAPFGQFPTAPLKISLPILPDSEARSVFGIRETLAQPEAGEHVLMVGFPEDTSPAQAAASARILSDAEAATAIAQSDDAAERSIPYDPAAEFLVNRIARNGMSGGGVFNVKGQLVGIMVRSPENPGAQPAFTRVTRIDWMHTQAERAMKQTSHFPPADPNTPESLKALLSAFTSLFSIE